jgi:hypothetical protein
VDEYGIESYLNLCWKCLGIHSSRAVLELHVSSHHHYFYALRCSHSTIKSNVKKRNVILQEKPRNGTIIFVETEREQRKKTF